MPHRSSLSYLQRYLVEEAVEDYREQGIARRELVRRVLAITGSIPVSAALLLQLGCGGSASSPRSGSTASAVSEPPGSRSSTSPSAGSTSTSALVPRSSSNVPVTATPSSQPPVKTGAAGTLSGTFSGSGSGVGTSSSAPADLAVSTDDPAVHAETVEFPGQTGTLKGYRALPQGSTKAPGLLVVHENRGLTAHIQDVTRRYAKAGYAALAVDLVSRSGGTDRFADAAQVTGILGQTKQEDLVQDLLSGLAYLKALPSTAGLKLGVVGYCFGGGLTWLLAVQSRDVSAAIPFYGPPPQPLDDVQKITAPVLAFYRETDARITSTLPNVQSAMQKYQKTFDYKVYAGAGHAFNNDAGGSYNAAAARDAFARSLDWLTRYLRA